VQFAVCGLCERESECFYPHPPGERFECNLVVMVNMNAMERVANRLEQLLGGRVVTGACRATHRPSSVMALFVLAPMGANEAVHLIAFDRFLEPALVRVLLVDSQQPPLTSLDDVVSDAAAYKPHTNAMDWVLLPAGRARACCRFVQHTARVQQSRSRERIASITITAQWMDAARKALRSMEYALYRTAVTTLQRSALRA